MPSRDVHRLLLALVPAVVMGCTPESEHEAAPVTAAESSRMLPAVPGVDPDRFDGHLAEIMTRVDPALDGWGTEVLSERAGTVLKKLAAVYGNSEIDSGLLGTLVAPGFTVVLPDRYEPVFSDSNVEIVRGLPAGAADRPRAGADLTSALTALRARLHGARDVRAKFKVTGVNGSGEGESSTVALFQASGALGHGTVQQNAVWTCRWVIDSSSAEPRLAGLEISDYEEVLPRAPSGGLRFVDATRAVFAEFPEQLALGVDHWRGRLEANYGVDPNGSQGIALGDVNGDGLDDLFVCQQGGLPNRLFVQSADRPGVLRDVSAASGVDWMEVCRAAILVDLDNDGDQDLVMAQGWHAMIMANDGRGSFSKLVERRSPANLYSVSAADYDNDGDLDLFFCGRNPGREMDAPEGILGMPIPYHDANNGGPNMLWRNDGDGSFVDVTERLGLDVNNRRYSFAAAWEDFDDDGDLDLYVANDYGRNNLYRNDVSPGGERRFHDVAAELGVEDISAGMSVSWGDADNDGFMDLYVSNMFSSAGNRIAFQRRFRGGDATALEDFRRHARGNSLFRNGGGSSFEDVSVPWGVTMGRWAWASTFVDLNNDGLEDIYVTNGYLTTEDSGDL